MCSSRNLSGTEETWRTLLFPTSTSLWLLQLLLCLLSTYDSPAQGQGDVFAEEFVDSSELGSQLLSAVFHEDFDMIKHIKADLSLNEQPDYIMAMGIWQSLLGNFKESDSFWEKIINRKHTEPFRAALISLEYGEHLMRANRFELADSIYDHYTRFLDSIFYQPILKARFHQQRSFQFLIQSKLKEAQEQIGLAEIQWQTAGKHVHPWHAKLQNQQGLLEKALGNFEKAEVAYQECIDQCARIGPGALGLMADALSNRSDLLRTLGDYKQGLGLYDKALSIYRSLGRQLDEAMLLGNKAATLDGMDSLQEAKLLYREALQKYQVTLGVNNLPYASTLSNLAGLLDYLGDADEAEEHYRSSISIIEKILGTHNLHYTTLLSNLALLLDYSNRNQEAIELFEEAVMIRSEVLGKRHPRYVDLLFNYAGSLTQYDIKRSIAVYEDATTARIDLIKYYYGGFDEETRLSYFAELEDEFARYYSTVAAHGLPQHNINLHAIHRAIKGLVLEYSTDTRHQVKKRSPDMFAKWQNLRDSISHALIMNTQERLDLNINLENMLIKAKELEKSWTRNTSSTLDSTQSFILAEDELAIDFIHFPWFGNEDSTVYYALVAEPQLDTPHLVYMGLERDLSEVLRQGFFPLEFSDQAENLKQMIIDPLSNLITKHERLVISPSGILHRIPFAGLKFKDKYLADLFQLVVVSNFRNAPLGHQSTDLKSALIVADLMYGGTPDMRKPFHDLPGTAGELTQITSLHSHLPLLVFSDTMASRKTLIDSISLHQPSLLHFATHGYSFAQRTGSGKALFDRIASSSNALLRCGLVLSNANSSWNQPISLQSSKGFLSAYDIASLQLGHTDLAFLSGCESGIGDLHSSEGVFGLPRAFMMAGAKSVIYTLWQIDDHYTSLFVRTFYQNLIAEGQVRRAFRKTQLELQHLHPFYWAGFVLLEG